MCQHDLHFYDDEYPADRIGDFFAEGIEQGDHCVALLRRDHRLAVQARLATRLQQSGLAIDRADFLAVDSEDVLSRMTIQGHLDLDRASELLVPMLNPPRRLGQGRVRAVGDLAPILHEQGRTSDAIAFEALMHKLSCQTGAAVMCVYPLRAETVTEKLDAMLRLAAQHAAVRFPPTLWIQKVVPPIERVEASHSNSP